MFLIKEFRHLQIQLQDVVSATNNFSSNKLVGCGGFGPVYKGELSLPEGPSVVAVKRLDPKFGQGNTEFWKEVMMLSKYKHENLISLMHFCFEGDERILVYEYAARGSLDRYLGDTRLTWIQRLKICIGVARGLNYLHDPRETTQRVLHRDIKSSNILLDEEWNAKVSDFGLSKVGLANLPQTFLVSNAVGTFGYCDPSYHETGLLSKETDVYSFGVVLLEVICGKLCCEYRNDQLIQILVPMLKKKIDEKKDDIICHDLKEQINRDCVLMLSTIAYRCLERDHKKRPNMIEIVEDQHQLCFEFYRVPVNTHLSVSCSINHATEVINNNNKKLALAMKKQRGNYKTRKNKFSWVKVSYTHEDDYVWSKYGQKDVLNSKYPSSYFRCLYQKDQGCMAQKQVQPVEGEPTKFLIKYIDHHTCHEILIHPYIQDSDAFAEAILGVWRKTSSKG